MPSFRDPNYTQVPNELMGDLGKPGYMKGMTCSELKVLLVIIRRTFGYGRGNEMTAIALSAIAEVTGLSRSQVVRAGKSLEKKGFIVREGVERKVGLWQLAVEEEESLVSSTIPDEESGVTHDTNLVSPMTPYKERVKEKHLTTSVGGLTDREVNQHPAVQVFRDIIHKYPQTQVWRRQIAAAVGPGDASIVFWRKIIEAWVGMGWNPMNAKGMLGFFERHEVPGNKNGRASGGPPAYSAMTIEEQEAMKDGLIREE